MNSAAAFQNWLSGFAKTYRETTVPDDAEYPRITYAFSSAEFGNTVLIPVSVWDRSYSWDTVEQIAQTITRAVSGGGKVGVSVPCDGGYLRVRMGNPRYQPMSDEDRAIRRIYMNIEVEYLTV